MAESLRRIALAVVVAALGCSDGPTGSSVDIGGVWQYEATFDDGTTYDVTLILGQHGPGGAFSGEYTGEATFVLAESDNVTFGVEGFVRNGVVDGGRVAFDFDTPEHHHAGTIQPSRMGGTVRIEFVEPDIGLPPSDGTWSASK